MKLKKSISLAMSVIMSLMLLSGCKSDNSSTDQGSTNGTADKNSSVVVGLATDEGGINDKSFNQSANEGVNRAVDEFGLKYITIEAQKKEDYEPNLQALIDEGTTLSFGIGYQLADDLKSVADQYPDLHFCIVDAVVEGSNILSVSFKEEEGSFLVGVLAGEMTKTNKVGFIGGKDVETINKFEAGFAAGVKSVNPEAAAGLISPDGKTPGTNVKYTDSYSDTNKGYEMAKSLYQSGCDIIYHAAGGAGLGLFQAAKELRGNGMEVWAIGVDRDQAEALPDYADVILSSMLKRVDNATYKVVKEEVDGNFTAGTLTLGIAEDGLELAPSTSSNVSEDVMFKVDDYKVKIKNGEIIVPSTRQSVIDFTI